MGCRLIVVTSATLRGGRNVARGDSIPLALCGESLICSKFSELSVVVDSMPIATVDTSKVAAGKLCKLCCVGIGAIDCFLECTGDGRTGDVGFGVRLIRRGGIVNEVSALFDEVVSFFSLGGGGGIIPCLESTFIGTGREIAMSVTASLDADGDGALRLTTFAGPVCVGVGELGLILTGEDAFVLAISLGFPLDLTAFGRSIDLLDSVRVI